MSGILSKNNTRTKQEDQINSERTAWNERESDIKQPRIILMSKINFRRWQKWRSHVERSGKVKILHF